MGMFDTVVIEGLKLPNLPKDVSNFLKNSNATIPSDYQTKDLENFLQTYTIDKKGQIYLTEYKPTGKKIPYQSPFKDWQDNRSLIERIYFNLRNKCLDSKYSLPKYIEERKPVKVKTSLTSTFEIYNYNEINGRYVDISYTIVAIKGKVTKVSLKSASVESESSAKKRHKENEDFKIKAAKEIAKYNEFKSKWYYPVLKETYNPFVFFASKSIQAICNAVIKATYSWRGV